MIPLNFGLKIITSKFPTAQQTRRFRENENTGPLRDPTNSEPTHFERWCTHARVAATCLSPLHLSFPRVPQFTLQFSLHACIAVSSHRQFFTKPWVLWLPLLITHYYLFIHLFCRILTSNFILITGIARKIKMGTEGQLIFFFFLIIFY